MTGVLTSASLVCISRKLELKGELGLAPGDCRVGHSTASSVCTAAVSPAQSTEHTILFTCTLNKDSRYKKSYSERLKVLKLKIIEVCV